MPEGTRRNEVVETQPDRLAMEHTQHVMPKTHGIEDTQGQIPSLETSPKAQLIVFNAYDTNMTHHMMWQSLE